MRKEAGYEVTDRISVSLIGNQVELLSSFIGMICEETLADSITGILIQTPDIDREIEIDGGLIQVAVQRN